MLHNRSFAKDCLISRNPEADFQHLSLLTNVEPTLCTGLIFDTSILVKYTMRNSL